MSLADDCKSDPPGKIFSSKIPRSADLSFKLIGMKVRIVSGTAGVTYLEADSMLGKKYTYVRLLLK